MKRLKWGLDRVNPAYILILASIGLTVWLTAHYQLVNSTVSDSIGYIQASRQLAQGDGLAYVDPHNAIGHNIN